MKTLKEMAKAVAEKLGFVETDITAKSMGIDGIPYEYIFRKVGSRPASLWCDEVLFYVEADSKLIPCSTEREVVNAIRSVAERAVA